MREHNGNDKRWTCPACRATFELLSDLIGHVKTVHPDEDVDLPDEKAG